MTRSAAPTERASSARAPRRGWASRRGFRDRGAVALVAVGTLGCPSPSIYGTPRTTARGSVHHTLALEGIYVRGIPPRSGIVRTDERGDPVEVRSEERLIAPNIPTYEFRYGVSDRVDFGLRIGSVLGADLKWNFWRSASFDMALDPAVHGFLMLTSAEGALVFQGHLPLLLGFNVSPDVTVVASPGLSVTLSSGGVDYTARSVVVHGGVMARLGLGLNVRASETFALQPEITAMRSLNDTEGFTVVLGLGLGFGRRAGDAAMRDRSTLMP